LVKLIPLVYFGLPPKHFFNREDFPLIPEVIEHIKDIILSHNFLVEEWTTQDVEKWVSSIISSHHVQKLQKADGQVLLSFTKKDLISTPYNLPRGSAAKLISAIQAMKISGEHFVRKFHL
jgi:hypothetical protein